MKSKVNFAIIGCGLISDFHIRAIQQIENAKLIGVCDYKTENAQKKSEEYNVKYYLTYEDLLGDPNIDAVCVCTPSGYHFEHSLMALSKGKHVLVEKPVSFTLESCDTLEKEATKQGVKLSVVSQLRFSENIQKVKECIDKGDLGCIVNANLSMNYYRYAEYYNKSSWRGTYEMDGGGALMNQGIHGIDLLRYLLGPVKSIYSISKTLVHNIQVEDTLSATVEFKNGALGNIQAATSTFPGTPRELKICGSQGTIILVENKITRFDIKDKPEYKALENSNLHFFDADDPKKIDSAGHMKQIKNFINAILTCEELLVKLEDGRNAVEIALSAYKSSKSKEVIYLER